jgi:hypothetical protein
MEDLGILIGWSFLALIVFVIWEILSRRVPALKTYEGKISPLTIALAIILTIAVSMLLSAIWRDLGKLVSFNEYGPLLNANLIFIHGAYAITILVIASILFNRFKQKGTIGFTLALPYFIASLIITIRFLFEAGRFVINLYDRLGVYLVIIIVIVIVSALLWYFQKQWEKSKIIN